MTNLRSVMMPRLSAAVAMAVLAAAALDAHIGRQESTQYSNSGFTREAGRTPSGRAAWSPPLGPARSGRGGR